MSSDDKQDRWLANPGYVVAQLMKALETAASDANAETRQRADAKAATWRSIIAQMLSGALTPGSRTPVQGTPAWVTLRVAQGGFATGEFMAEGSSLPHETMLAARLRIPVDVDLRARLNAWYLTDPGRAQLSALLASGRYRIDVPEEGALLVVVWLIEQKESAAAAELLAAISPWIDRLRFYPVAPAENATSDGLSVRLETVGALKSRLLGMTVPAAIKAMRETLTVWNPVSDRVAALLHETVNGEPPRLIATTESRPRIEGGWPCQQYPDGWHHRARALLAEIAVLRKEHSLCARPVEPTSNLARLLHVLRVVTTAPERLRGRDVGFARTILAQIAAARGLPGSEREQAIRAEGLTLAKRPSKADLAAVLAARLTTLSEDRGLTDPPEVYLGPVSADEAQRHRMPSGLPLADYFAGVTERAREAPVETLIEAGVIGSAELLAMMVPQLSSHAIAAGAADPRLRRLQAALYEAFRGRRSLLLVNLQSQIQFSELPWVRATAHARAGSKTTRNASRELLERVATLTLTRFPQTIVPNPMVRELDALARAADLDIPMTEELAADIFMGTVTQKFLAAAKRAGELMSGSLYERYYGLSYADIARLGVERSGQNGPMTALSLVAMCRDLAGTSEAGNWSVARNGRIIEQLQIVTTHNLAQLVDGLELRMRLQPAYPGLAARNLDWIIAELARPLPDSQRHARLIRRKTTAYAWRQMVFFLALVDRHALDAALSNLQQRIVDSPDQVRTELLAYLDGVRSSADGPLLPMGDNRRYLGWV